MNLVCADGLRFEQQHVFQNFMDVDRAQRQLRGPREIEQLLDQLIHPVDFADHDVGKIAHRRVAVGGTAQQLRRALDATEGIANFMGQACRQSTHQGQAIGAFEILFEFLATLDVAQKQDRADETGLRDLGAVKR